MRFSRREEDFLSALHEKNELVEQFLRQRVEPVDHHVVIAAAAADHITLSQLLKRFSLHLK